MFDLDLESYEAYDKDRLPFNVHVKAFFRIGDSNVAAQRVASFDELQEQLKAIVQGAVRVILASHDIEEILQGRATFGKQFTEEVSEQLANWGVATVKNIELMDIRDSKDSNVIKNIMEKKKSHIEMESRQEVAKNKKVAQMAEIDAQQEVDLQKQQALQQVGLRTVEANQKVALSQQNMNQVIKEQERTTKEKEMAVLQVQHVRTAEIQKQVQLVQAEQQKETSIVAAQGSRETALISASAAKDTALLNAEATKQTTILTAEGAFEAKSREAQGIALEGTARADAERAMLLAPVEAQVTLAKEIGGNQSYQEYLITIRKVEAQQAVGMEQAKALEKADVKVIANTGNVASGMDNVMDLFTSKGGTQVGAMLEGLSNTEAGQALVKKLTSKS